LTVSSGGDLPVFCSIHDAYGVFVAIGIVEEQAGPYLLRVGRIRPAQTLARCMSRRGQREFVLRLSGGSRYSALVQTPGLVEETRRCDFLVLGYEKATETLAQSVVFASSE
jgi:hypothetical protein